MALVAYRNLFRAIRIAFEGDAPILSAARAQIRSQFRQRSSLDPQDAETTRAVQHAEEVANFLRKNVVQGKKLDADEHSYKLRIHEHTERGDNESIKTAGEGKMAGSGCCGGSKGR